MRTAMFHNFSSEPFIGYWNGRPHTFKVGEKKFMPEYLARHFAKHLSNRELLREGKETATSPKFPEQVPDFMDMFNKGFIMEKDASDQDEAGLATDVANQEVSTNLPEQPSSNIRVKPNAPLGGPGAAPQVITPPDAGSDDGDEFEGMDKS